MLVLDVFFFCTDIIGSPTKRRQSCAMHHAHNSYALPSSQTRVTFVFESFITTYLDYIWETRMALKEAWVRGEGTAVEYLTSRSDLGV